MTDWRTCPLCHQSCTGQYRDTIGCYRCNWSGPVPHRHLIGPGGSR